MDTTRRASGLVLVVALLALLGGGCAEDGTDGATGPQGPPGPPGPPGDDGPPEVGFVSARPGVNVEVVSLEGGTGPNGNFVVGDTVSVTYTVKTDDGDDIDVPTMHSGAIYISGPTTNYQRVISSQGNLRAGSVDNGDGTWTYTFASPIPATYLAPLNDSPSFGTADGEMTGQPLEDGTYTIGMTLRKDYEIDGEVLRDPGATVFDFLLGAATVIAPRDVVGNQNCNVCHTEVRAHGEGRFDVRLCILCHTSGSEDKNDPAVAGGTPGVSVDFRVMIHKIHNAKHLPSVLGVAAGPSGVLDYTVAPRPLLYAGHSLADLSDIGFPVWPNLNVQMPRDLGYSLLASADPDGSGPLLSPRARDDEIRRGVTACAKCHGDPDADGPLLPPAQGNLAETNPQRNSCGSCHDDLDYARPYVTNGSTMPANATSCNGCHPVTGSGLSVRDAHVHPLVNGAIDPGVNSVITAVAGGTGPNGNHQVGDTVAIQFTLKDDAGTDIGLASLDSASAFFFGPNPNRQLIMPLTSPNGIALNPYDFSGRLQSSSTSNKGTMSKIVLGATAVQEALVVEFTTATTFDVTGRTTGALGTGTLPGSPSTNPAGSSVSALELGPGLSTGTIQIAFTSPTAFTVTGVGGASAVTGSGTLPAATSASTRFTSTNLNFNISVGSTAFAAGNTIHVGVFRGAAANPVLFAIVCGRTAFAVRDRFYYEVVPNSPTYTLNLPMDIVLEHLGNGNGLAGQVLSAAGNLPVHYGRQQLWEATAPGATAVTTAAVTALGREVGVLPATGFANGDTVVVEPAGAKGVREYVQIAPARADGVIAAVGDTTTRIHFKTPLRYAHASGVTIQKVTLSFRQEGGTSYTLNPATGVVTAGTTPFGAGLGIVMSYRTDGRFGYSRHGGDTVQAFYVPPANDGLEIGQEQAEWKGLPYQDGTYTADIWFYRNIDHGLFGELQTYRSTSDAGTMDFLYGNATTIEPRAVISEAANCYTCHNDVIFHGGGRRGVDACLTCHGISGCEDKPRWDTPKVGSSTTDTALTPGVAIEFRQMLHKIHMGRDLANAHTYTVVGNQGNPSTYEHVGFPAMPGGVRQCVRCHGNEAWHEPAPRVHASALVPAKTWTVVCGSCHDSGTAQAHIDAQTSGAGQESCSVCHGPGRSEDVAHVHPVK